MKKKDHLTKFQNQALRNVWHLVDDIKAIKIQGATNIAKAAFLGMKEFFLHSDELGEDFFVTMTKAVKAFFDARQTEPLLFNGMKHLLSTYHANKKLFFDKLQKKLCDACDYLLDEVARGDHNTVKYAHKLLKNGMLVMTHCHSGTVVKVLKAARDEGKHFHIINTETRPLFQGRLTAKDLLEYHIPTTLIVDDAAPYFLDHRVEKNFDLNLVFIGCDAIKPNGNVYNKIGSFAIGLSAHRAKIPLYVIGNLLKVDADNRVGIEMRSPQEVRPDAPKGLEIINYAFDEVPADYITGIVTGEGIFSPKNIRAEAEKKYPFIKEKMEDLLSKKYSC